MIELLLENSLAGSSIDFVMPKGFSTSLTWFIFVAYFYLERERYVSTQDKPDSFTREIVFYHLFKSILLIVADFGRSWVIH